MDIRTLTVGLLSFGLFAGAGALVVGQSGQTVRPGITRTSLTPVAPPEDVEDQDDETDAGDDEGDCDEAAITFDQAPAPVQAAALRLAGDAKNISEITRETDDDVTLYEIEFTENGARCSAELTADGDVVEMERAMDASKLPPAALKALKEEYPSASFGETTVITKVVYQLTIRVDGKDHAITISGAGCIEDDSFDDDCGEDADSDHDDEDEDGDAKPTPTSGPGIHGDPA